MVASRVGIRAFAIVGAMAVGGGIGLAAASCTVTPTKQEQPPATTSFYRDIKPIVDAKCIGCHYDGGIAPFALTSYADVQKQADAVKQAITTHTMPPWLADDSCIQASGNSYVGDRSLSQDQIDVISKWVDEKAPEGDPKVVGAPLEEQMPSLSRVDATMAMPAMYTPQSDPDDYHCFVLDWPSTDVEYVTGFRATPGDPRVVHHVIAFLAEGADATTVTQKNAENGGNGYTCFGGPGFNAKGWIGAWAPGSMGSDYPAGTGLKVSPGAKIVLQVHYNTLTAGRLPDQTSIQMKLDKTVAKEGHMQPWANPAWLQSGGMPIPPDTNGVHFGWGYDATILNGGKPMTIYSVGLHMHTLGHHAQLSVQHPSGPDTCLLNIPQWNFHWQGGYGLDQPFTFNPGDKMYLQCDFDNTTPNMVQWGESTTDEMCLGVFYYTSN